MDSFQETVPRKTDENAKVQPPRWLQKFDGRNNTTIFDNIDIGDLLTPIRRCSSRLRCADFQCPMRTSAESYKSLLNAKLQIQWSTMTKVIF